MYKLAYCLTCNIRVTLCGRLLIISANFKLIVQAKTSQLSGVLYCILNLGNADSTNKQDGTTGAPIRQV